MNISILGHVCIDKNTSEHTSYVAAGSPAMFMNRIYKQFPNCPTNIIASYGQDFLKYLNGIRQPIAPLLQYRLLLCGWKLLYLIYNKMENSPLKCPNCGRALTESELYCYFCEFEIKKVKHKKKKLKKF